ncbi:hypothetical protein BHQ21_25785 [Mycobacterium sherrisii]|uniref:DUF3631 domain-containing protein n=1 Tax=Mycobacterium sherrisii TaxID=243061 RepID=A0A1E3SAN7_9MYCO|nr:DUF3631 domain-containing protein [Mycobacterium sherrisii]ODQ98637.1 hypothetical protein BHQ21_25785 [Mycobacterium sherrisii]
MTALSDHLADIAHLAPVNGRTVLDAVADFLDRFIAYPSEHALYAHALWLAHTWRMDEWDSTPRLAFMSPEKGSGKTRSLEVSEHLVPRAVRVSQATTGYILAKISEDPPPTLFYDEIDTVYGRNARGNEDLRAVLNAGHRQGAIAGRRNWGNDGLAGQDYPAYCAVALASLGRLRETVADRAVVIHMKKRKQTERVEPWRPRVNAKEAEALGDALGAWMRDAALSWPHNMPVEDRAADVWEALIMVADAAGGHWPASARAAAVVLTSEKPQASRGIELLRDLRIIFGSNDKMRSEHILGALAQLPESPWNRFHADGTPLDFRELARLLKEYDIRPKDVWIDGVSAKGYTADDLRDAWERYIHPSTVREDRENREKPCTAGNL